MVAGVLINYGANSNSDLFSNNIYTGKPSITFFKSTYKKHTNFAIETIQQIGNTTSLGSSIVFDIPDNGDLLYKTHLELTFNADSSSDVVPYVGLRAIDYIEFLIGGTVLDKQYSEWMYIWNELSLPHGKKEGYFSMVGGPGKNILHVRNKIIIPLQFWFCRNPGLALPLQAINQNIQIKVQFNRESLINNNEGSPVNMINASLWCDIIFLDTTESSKFINDSHYYLFEQLQQLTTSVTGTSTNFNINIDTINHTVKELFIVGHIDDNDKRNWFNYSNKKNIINSAYQQYSNNIYGVSTVIGPNNYNSSTSDINKNIITSMKLTLDGNERVQPRDGTYFNLTQPYQHHTCIPNNVGINVYSFAINPEELQPSGSCNFNNFNSIKLEGGMSIDSASNTSNITFTIYAINYANLTINNGYFSYSGGGGTSNLDDITEGTAGTGTVASTAVTAGTAGTAGTASTASTATASTASIAEINYINTIPGLEGISLTGDGQIGSDSTNTSDVSTNLLITNLKIINSNGTTVNFIRFGENPVQINATVQNTRSIPQIFKYIVSVTNQDGVNMFEDFINDSLSANSSMNPAIAWKPITAGQYTITASIIDNQNKPLAPSITLSFNVI